MKKEIRFLLFPLLIMGVSLVFTNSCKKDETTSKKNPVITWANPSDISFGTLLSSTQLNATADVLGTFVYSPPIGTKLNEGVNQDLNVSFTPTDALSYNTLNKTVKINVSIPNNPANLQMENIPAGTFMMGSPIIEIGRQSDETQFQVTLTAFRMSKYEITNAEFAVFLNAKSIGNNGKYAAGAYPEKLLIMGSTTWGLHYTGYEWVPVAGYENHPVIRATWYGATEFATYAGGTLPTEAQWEYACRANTTTPFYTGNCLTDSQANYFWAFPSGTCTNVNTIFPDMTQAAGSYPANAYGLNDMYGNVWEWCSDWYWPEYPTTPQTNPTGTSTGNSKVIRGGSYHTGADMCRSAMRGKFNPEDYYEYVGFRIVLIP